jgi:hypothetical protein
MRLHHSIAAGAALCLAAGMPAQAAVSSGTTTVQGTFSFDFDAGVQLPSVAAPADIFWQQFTSSTRAVTPASTATIVNLGMVSYAALDLAALSALSYGTAGIDGSDAGSLLVTGDVFAVKTDLGNYAKVMVTGPYDASLNNGLALQWETLAPVPEPATYGLLLAGLALVGGCARRSRRG